MGDDIDSHASTETVRPGTTLSAFLGAAEPHVGSIGWSWLARVDDVYAAVWSIDHGVQLLVDDYPITRGTAPRNLYWVYWQQIDPAWLHHKLSGGAPVNFKRLHDEYKPIGLEKQEREERQRERDIDERCVSANCMRAIENLGADIELHNDRLLRFDLLGLRWTFKRNDSMFDIYVGDDSPASIRPLPLAERWLLTAVATRSTPCWDLFSLAPAESTFEWRAMSPTLGRPARWEARKDYAVAQLEGDDAVACFRFAEGRTLEQIIDAFVRGE
ncbi:hypothetical protein TPB0596_16660 [Tsukamurella pulmonis]|uniref:Uncharacterized protein n=2 Tax=Tsukamurella pulmonis TaxID=47312 RepID=A0A1H1G9Y3_9ACTN|nr:hypothetical protein [Tsukamurella pulmonis]KXO87906.1 hypothetical protein AXK56_16215 [Tsukamurella pulmonis]BDD81903.1 hypothetical protein TPB0596_16660 [Tsukamurella pulmonis]SDR10000.1 hypothetical protein SAMN04489765_3203 [Tsukamurella pulmonis]SUP17596.1 Uncharacterised protein [Tsukamurella pulmonis]